MSEDTIPHTGFRSRMRADLTDAVVTVVQPTPQARGDAPEPDGESEVFEPSSPALHRSLPHNTALLAVTEDQTRTGAGHFRLAFAFQGRYEESHDADIVRQVAPDLSLHSIAERGDWEKDCRELRSWWKDLSRLRRWMARLAAKADARLLVWDNTNYQLPWELYYVGEAGQPNSGWLGAMIEVVRWTSLLATGRETVYTAVECTSTGHVLLLETEDITASGDGVTSLTAGIGPPPLHKMDALKLELAREDLRFGLLLVHCHGVNATNANEFSIAERTLNEIDEWPMPALSQSHAVVLLNACNTAKIVPPGPHVQRATHSFAEMFLRKGASSVIATLGKVSLDHTYAFTDRLLRPDDPERRISRLLLQHRKEYATKLANSDHRPDRYQQFLYCFMYVYFGHPDTMLYVESSTPGRAA